MCANYGTLKVVKQHLAAIIRPMQRRVANYYYFRFPEQRHPCGRPFNGQHKRRELFLSLIFTCRPAAIIETGAYMGVSTAFMAKASKLPVYSVEADAQNFDFAKMRLRKRRNVQLSFGDSREYL